MCLPTGFVAALYLLMLTTMRKKKEELWYIRVVSDSESMPGTLGNAANIGFFLPDPSRRPPQLGFRASVL